MFKSFTKHVKQFFYKDLRIPAKYDSLLEANLYGGSVWKDPTNGDIYHILFLTNAFSTSEEIQVVYSKHWANVCSMPADRFIEKFEHDPSVCNRLPPALFDLMALVEDIRGVSRPDLPKEGDVFVRKDRVPRGVDHNHTILWEGLEVEVEIEGIVPQTESQQFVLFREKGKRKVLNLYAFLTTYHRKVTK